MTNVCVILRERFALCETQGIDRKDLGWHNRKKAGKNACPSMVKGKNQG
ncbi:hypothetical protein [Pelolinea submarina]|nr:hypothetical protein [Pelolinea submarina]